MHFQQIGERIFLVDLETGGFKNLIASYVIKGDKAIIVESGPTSSIPTLLLAVKEIGVKIQDVAYIAISHVHLDHGGGVGNLLKALPNAKVIVHPRGAPHLINPEKLWAQSQKVLGSMAEVYGAPEPVPKNRIITAEEGQIFGADNKIRLKVVEALGHAAHNLSFHDLTSDGIFSGDAAGIYLKEFNVLVPTTPPPFRLDFALASLKKLANLNPQFLYYSHFGKTVNAVSRLKEYGTQLKLWASIAEEGARKGQNMKAIRDKILARDPAMQKICDFLRSHTYFMKTAVENSVQGFVEFSARSRL